MILSNGCCCLVSLHSLSTSLDTFDKNSALGKLKSVLAQKYTNKLQPKTNSQEVDPIERNGHDSGSESVVVSQLREEIHELKQRLEKCDKKTQGAQRPDDDRAEDLAAKCRELEETLDLMRGEFENMEDYWQVGRHAVYTLRILLFEFIFRLKRAVK